MSGISNGTETGTETGTRTSAFTLAEHLEPKADPALIAGDERHFAAIAESLAGSVADLSGRLETELRAPGGTGQAAMDRDLEVHRLSARLRTLRRYGLDLCLGHMVGAAASAEGTEPVYIGRLGLTDSTGRRLLLDWRSPAAEPFFGATHANPMGLASRRRYRWTFGRISDYWDEVFTAEGLDSHAALDDQSAFIASLGSDRSARMRDVLATIAADQDAIIRAGSRGALVVDGGPGTGKTVVALHRSAYLLYADPRLGQGSGGVLFVGPSRPYLSYVADVLPSLGEEGVATCTVRDLVAEGAAATDESNREVARLKSSARWLNAIDAAVRIYEEAPTTTMTVETHWADVRLRADDWTEAFNAADPGTPHNDARALIWDELVSIIVDKHRRLRRAEREQRGTSAFAPEPIEPVDRGEHEERDEDIPLDQLRRSLAQNTDLRTVFNRAWPLLAATDIVADLWSVPAYLRRCAPWLDADDVRALARPEGAAWTVSDVPLLDAARRRLGDPAAAMLTRRRAAAIAAERAQMDRVVEEILQGEDEDGMFAQLRQPGLRDALVDSGALPEAAVDPLAGPFAHIVVDEAQELTDAEWQMLLARCPSRSFTIVGDRAQARHGFTESWDERLKRIGVDAISLASLSINYRTPAEIMAEAEPVIRAVLPDANVPTSIRSGGAAVVHGSTSELRPILGAWLAENTGPLGSTAGIACVIAAEGGPDGTTDEDEDAFAWTPRVRWLTPELSKGLEFDLVVLVDPEAFGTGIEGAVDRYVAMTRATQQLVVLTR